MGKFFLPGTPLYKKIMAFIILAPFAAVFVVPFIDFLPSSDVVRWSKLISAGLSVLFTVLFCFSHKKIKREYSHVYPKRKISLALYMLGMPIMLFTVFYMSFAYSFSRICHIFASDETEIIVSLSEKGLGRLSGYYFEFTEYDYLWFKQLDGIRKRLWTDVTIGERLLLTGTQSPFGFVVHSIEKYSMANSGDSAYRLLNRKQRLVRKWFVIVASLVVAITVPMILARK